MKWVRQRCQLPQQTPRLASAPGEHRIHASGGQEQPERAVLACLLPSLNRPLALPNLSPPGSRGRRKVQLPRYASQPRAFDRPPLDTPST